MFTINKIIEVSFDVLLSRNKWVFEVKLLLSFWWVSLSGLCFELTPPSEKGGWGVVGVAIYISIPQKYF